MAFPTNPYFNPNEFDSPDQIGSGNLMHEDFITKLVIARKLAAIPFKITSGYRSPNHNRKVGGVANSSHTIGRAADIAVNDSNRYEILTSLIDAGFTRIGIGRTFIHCDDDPTKNAKRIWHYYPTTRAHKLNKVSSRTHNDI